MGSMSTSLLLGVEHLLGVRILLGVEILLEVVIFPCSIFLHDKAAAWQANKAFRAPDCGVLANRGVQVCRRCGD
jgi:hypothetical protein